LAVGHWFPEVSAVTVNVRMLEKVPFVALTDAG
jgi:hypothetical protein